MTINLTTDSEDKEVQALYDAGFTFEQVIALTKYILKILAIHSEYQRPLVNKW